MTSQVLRPERSPESVTLVLLLDRQDVNDEEGENVRKNNKCGGA